jgi:hypothetical protein
VLLDFILQRRSYLAEAMARAVTRALSAKEVLDRLLSVTCNNARNNSTIVRCLEERLDNKNITGA